MVSKIIGKLMNWVKVQSKQPKLLILDIIIAGLTVFLMFMIGFAVEEATYSYNVYDEDSFYWRLESEEYASMVNMYHMNVAAGKGEDRKLQEYYGVAEYFEAAADYKMYVEAGEKELADAAYGKMQKAYNKMGDFAILKEKIEAKLGLEVSNVGKADGTEVTFLDDFGREVTVSNPQRVITLTGSFSDIWYLAGGIEQLVATTNATWTYFDLPLRADIVNLGASKQLNLEQIIACEPDLILASCGTDRNVELEAAFEEMGLNVAYFSVNSFEDYLRVLDICTRITGCTENTGLYGTQVQEQVENALARVDGSKPRVLYVRATGSSCKVKNSEGTVLGEMLYNMDCVNIADLEGSLLEQLSVEVILDADPDYIFVVLQSANPSDAEKILETTLLSNPAWATLSAVQEGRYYVMDQNLYNLKPNARWGEAYEQLADILYPSK